jgi:hypothetical protein
MVRANVIPVITHVRVVRQKLTAVHALESTIDIRLYQELDFACVRKVIMMTGPTKPV